MSKNQETKLDPPIVDDPLVRLSLIQQRDGFFAVSLGEITEALVLGSYGPKGGGAAKHLNDILVHQMKENVNIEDPTSTVRSIAREYVNYHETSKKTVEDLTKLLIDVKEIDNPHLSLEMAIGLNHLGLAGLVRFMDLKRLVSAKTIKEDEINPLSIDYTDEPKLETFLYIEGKLKDMNIKSIRNLVPKSLQDQQNRYNFWHQRLVESSWHMSARPIVMEALKN